MVLRMVVLVAPMLLQEEATVAHHGMEVRQVVNTIEETHAATVEAPTAQVPQMIHTMHVHVEMVAQKVVRIQIQAAQIAIHLVDITTHVLREQVVHLKVAGQVAAEIRQEVHLLLQTQAIQEVHLRHLHQVGAVAEAVVQALLAAVAAVAQVVAVVAVEAAVGQDN